ncbi:hypothetical protein LSUE1_G001843 [Lachnellula suecica]|uniref:Uncharacterized protein n=1 Tax=Lachnellula suecica TaxID=602035 RepID=A0A8T9CJX0_9HELO|nr:hypothetical protein LSUE1_G001843 [Lachnellula suecica]
MSAPSPLELIHSYRHMYRALLRAVQYSKPARYTARDQLRNAYRKGQLSDFNRFKIIRTIEFLDGARRTTGMEHKILKNLLQTRRYYEESARQGRPKNMPGEDAARIYKTAFLHYDMTLAMLNDSMNLCLR